MVGAAAVEGRCLAGAAVTGGGVVVEGFAGAVGAVGGAAGCGVAAALEAPGGCARPSANPD